MGKIISAVLLTLAALFACGAYSADAREFAPVWSPYAKAPHNHYPLPCRYMWDGGRGHTRAGMLQPPSLPTKALVILAEFNDERFFYNSTVFQKMLLEKGYSAEGATGCAQQYFQEQLGNDFTITVAGIVRVQNDRHYYGENSKTRKDIHAGEFVAEACLLAAAEPYNVNFSDFDQDGDGFVDNVFVFYAGEDEALQPEGKNEDYIWAHCGSLSGGDYGKVLEIGKVKIDGYACASELFITTTGKSKMASIGTFCHEYAHSIGLMDMYDTDYELSGGTSAGLWRHTCLMDAGNYNNEGNTPPNFNAIERERLGLLIPKELTPGSYTVQPIGTKGAATFKVTNPADSTDYFLFEARCAKEGSWDNFIGGSGLLVYHIDKSGTRKMASETYQKDLSPLERWNVYNEINCRPDHQCADLIEADGRSDKDPANAAFNDISGIFFPSGTASAIGHDANIKLSFWDGTQSTVTLSAISLKNDGSVTFSVSDAASPLPPEPTEPLKDEDPLYIIVQYNASVSGAVVTKGTVMEMKVSNSVGATLIEWFFDGTAIADPKAFTATATGEISAIITYAGGAKDCITKRITVR